jgi:uncharacterized protein YcbK (DUF882 family)
MYFTPSEFACRCCGKHPIDSLFLAQLERAREISGVPYVINSGYRCPKHNAEVGSTSANHTSGKAADISAKDGPTRGKILKGLYRAGFTRIGISKDFIHVDSMDEVESAWLYG